jgi:hypothetical protein
VGPGFTIQKRTRLPIARRPARRARDTDASAPADRAGEGHGRAHLCKDALCGASPTRFSLLNAGENANTMITELPLFVSWLPIMKHREKVEETGGLPKRS